MFGRSRTLDDSRPLVESLTIAGSPNDVLSQELADSPLFSLTQRLGVPEGLLSRGFHISVRIRDSAGLSNTERLVVSLVFRHSFEVNESRGFDPSHGLPISYDLLDSAQLVPSKGVATGPGANSSRVFVVSLEFGNSSRLDFRTDCSF
jgi:hypothetical protein